MHLLNNSSECYLNRSVPLGGQAVTREIECQLKPGVCSRTNICTVWTNPALQSIYPSNPRLKQQQHNLCLSYKQGEKGRRCKEVFVLACNRNHNLCSCQLQLREERHKSYKKAITETRDVKFENTTPILLQTFDVVTFIMFIQIYKHAKITRFKEIGQKLRCAILRKTKWIM